MSLDCPDSECDGVLEGCVTPVDTVGPMPLGVALVPPADVEAGPGSVVGAGVPFRVELLPSGSLVGCGVDSDVVLEPRNTGVEVGVASGIVVVVSDEVEVVPTGVVLVSDDTLSEEEDVVELVRANVEGFPTGVVLVGPAPLGVALVPPADVEAGRGWSVGAGVSFKVVPLPSESLVECGVDSDVVLELCPGAGPTLGLPSLGEAEVEEEPGAARMVEDPWLPKPWV